MRIAGEIILKSLGAWVAIWGFSRLLNAPKKLECYTAGVGMIGWAVYLIVEVFNDGILMKNFLAAVAVALVSQAMARHFKAPVILFVIPGILPMVPGSVWKGSQFWTSGWGHGKMSRNNPILGRCLWKR